MNTDFTLKDLGLPLESLPGEKWRPIPETRDRYYVSNMGRILTRKWHNAPIPAFMKPALDHCGYLRTMILRNGKYHTIKMHREIAKVFIPNPLNKPTINHINGIKSDNRIENLEWATWSENVSHAFATGLESNAGENHPKHKLTDAIVLRARQMRKEGMKYKDIAKELGFKEEVLNDCCTRSWLHVKFP
jgi:hypothetical protein